ncbi:MAG: M56 family metallopeptidase [Acidobacteriia bacterium]|nr:M56 family metallopeptidase [Terriglobia bacterium]
MLNHLWQSTLFAGAVALLALLFRENRAQVRSWLWLGASLKFLIPFSILLSLGSRFAPLSHSVAAQTDVPFSAVEIVQPFPAMPALHGRASFAWIFAAALGVWICGLAAVATIRFRAWLRIRDAGRSSILLDVPGCGIQVRCSPPGLLEPGVVGFFRPILLLPESLLERLTPAQFQAVLAHEMCHVHRRDNLASAIHMVVEAIYWFHPLVWWIGSRMVDERERACDEEVCSQLCEPHEYAKAILDIYRWYLESPLLCSAG